MKIYDAKAYWQMKQNFLKHHKNDFDVWTSQMNEYSCYYKEYICKDGAIWYESMGPELKEITASVGELATNIKVTVEFFRTEFWSTDNAESGFVYEQY